MTIRGVLSLTGASLVVLDAVRASRIALVGSRPYFTELHRTLTRPRIARRYGITPRRDAGWSRRHGTELVRSGDFVRRLRLG